MKTRERIERDRIKPFRAACKEGDYTAYFETKAQADDAATRHMKRYDDHEVVVTRTVFL